MYTTDTHTRVVKEEVRNQNMVTRPTDHVTGTHHVKTHKDNYVSDLVVAWLVIFLIDMNYNVIKIQQCSHAYYSNKNIIIK